MRTAVVAVILAGVLGVGGCADDRGAGDVPGGDHPLRLTAEARPGRRPPVTPGTSTVALPTGAEGLVRVPEGYDANRPAPLVVLLHGAGATAGAGLALLEEEADATGALLVAPSSRDRTW